MEEHGYRYELIEPEESEEAGSGLLNSTTRESFLDTKLQTDILNAIQQEIKRRTATVEEKQMLAQNKRLGLEDGAPAPPPKRKKLKGDVLSRLSKKIKYKTGD